MIRKALLLDARSLALARIGLALVLLGDLLARAADLATFYSDLGVLPRELLGRATEAMPSLHSMGGSPAFEAVLFPQVYKKYPLLEKTLYAITGKITEEFGVSSLEVISLKRLEIQFRTEPKLLSRYS